MNEFAIAEFLGPVGYVFGHDVCMDVYFHKLDARCWMLDARYS
jgi:hypothetical protein